MNEITIVESPLDYIDILIAYGLAKYSPRNIYRLSRELGIPESTIRYRIKMMRKKKLMHILTNVYHTNLGLKKLFLFADVNPLFWDNIIDLFRENGYWSFLTQILANKPMLYGLYIIPYRHVPDAIEFFDEMTKLDIVYDYDLYHSTCFHRVNPNTEWYDVAKNGWVFDWQQLIQDIELADHKLPITLRDPDRFENLADEMDIQILRKLEVDATIPFSQLAKELKTTPQNIRYHFNEHIIKRFLIEGYEIFIKKYTTNSTALIYTVVQFTNHRNMGKFANVFRVRPYTEVMGKILKKDALMVNLNIPMSELVNYISTLNELVKLGYIRNYKYYITPPGLKRLRQTIPYKFFINGDWVYDHDEMMSDLHSKFEEITRSLKIVTN